jgi:hypothetical protein
MAERDVRKILSEVGLATAQSTVAAVGSGDLQKEAVDFLLCEADFFTRGGALRLTSNRETVAVWKDSEVHHIAQAKQQEFRDSLEMCAQAMAESGSRRVENIRGNLGQFLMAVVRRSADELSTNSVEAMIGSFIHEVSGGALEWRGIIWLSGIIAAENPIRVTDGITLRRPESGDFSRRVPADLGVQRLYPFPPDSVLECYIVAPEPPDLGPLINALSLYRAAPVKPYLRDWTSNSLLRNHSFSHDLAKPSSPGLSSPELSTADDDKLRPFVQAVADRLPLIPLGHHSDATWNGMKFYFRALHNASDVEERLFLVVASLEASLLLGARGGSHMVKQRASVMLQFAGYRARDVFESMSEAYKFRNSYAHGEDIKVEELGRVRDLGACIMNFARLVLVKLIDFPDAAKRRELLKQLDWSLLDSNEREKVKAILEKGLWDFIGP